MFKKPFVLGIPASGAAMSTLALRGQLAGAGQNTGNYLFAHAVHQQVGFGRPNAVPRKVEGLAVRRECDCVVIPAANWLKDTANLDVVSDAVEQIDLPTVAVGLGAQAASRDVPMKLNKSCQRFLRVLAERSARISVRGEFTRQVLADHGVDHVTVTGCPSLLIAGETPARVERRVEALTSYDQLAINSTRHLYSREIFEEKPGNALKLEIYRKALEHNIPLVFQSELPDFYYCHGRNPDKSVEEQAQSYLEEVYAAPIDQIEAYLKKHGHVFFDVPSWRSFLEAKSFVIGTRIHGAIAGLLAGVPSAVIVHDSRTSEMTESLKIPSVQADAVGEFSLEDINRVYQSLDWSEFQANYSEYRERFQTFFRTCKLEVMEDA